MKLAILYEDEFLIAVNKPAGLPSQQTLDKARPHVISVLKQQFPGQNFYLHHRLDKETSGILLLAKHPRANAPLTEIFREHKIEKTYSCLCLHSAKSKSIETEFQIVNHLAPVRGGQQRMMRMVEVKKGGWRAETNFKILKTSASMDWVQAKPKTGRTHQIRVHLAGLYRPIAGDFLYGGKSSAVPRLMLHAEELKLAHPVSNEALLIKAELPEDFKKLLLKL